VVSRSTRTLTRVLVATGAALALATTLPLRADGDPGVEARTVLTFVDDRIDESSGLAVRRGRVLTVNDSGDGAHVYWVDPRSGRTTAVTTYDDEEPTDVEAVAPGRGGTVWVADIGDNHRLRSTVTVHRLPLAPGRVHARRFELAYPGPAHDAETLLVHPRTGRLFVVTKVPFLGGEVSRAPARLDAHQVNELTRVGDAPSLVTDGAFLPGGRHVVLRTYATATVLSYPGFEPVRTFPLPEQELGEGVAPPGADDRLWLSSEGPGTQVLEVRITPPLSPRSGEGDPVDRVDPAREPWSQQRSPEVTSAGPDETTASDPASPGDEGDGVGLGRPQGYAAVAVLAALVGVLVRASRRRSRRRR
jgi:hypothetical protein